MSGLLSRRPNIMDSRSFELAMKHRPGCRTIEFRRLNFVCVGPSVATVSTPRSSFYRRQLAFEVTTCGFEFATKLLAEIPRLRFDQWRGVRFSFL
jgi:hypothetical protein